MFVRPKTAPSLCNNVTSTSVHGNNAFDSLGTDALTADVLGSEVLGNDVLIVDTFVIDVLEVRLLLVTVLETVDFWRDGSDNI